MQTESGRRSGWMAGVMGLAIAFAIGLLPTPCAQAASGTWTYAGNGIWSDTIKWQGGIVADGADSTAAISASISASPTVTLDSPRSAGSLSFSDNSSQNNYWTLSDGGNSANTLTLTNTTSTTPTVIASNDKSYVNVTLTGSQGVLVRAKNALATISGSPGLFFGRLNTYSGVTTISIR